MAMKVLFIGGTGNISLACTKLLAGQGIDLHLLARGATQAELPASVRLIRGDIRGKAAASLVEGHFFDAVVEWIAYLPEHIEADIDLFRGRTSQYLFISSASAYQKPPSHYIITEETPLANPYWQYSQDKIRCEARLLEEYSRTGFPVTIVRPSYTYGETWIPCVLAGHGYTLADRMLRKQKVIVHGDGNSLWTMTHNTDFAAGFCSLLGRPEAIGEAYHITSDEVLTWNAIYREIGAAVGVEPDIVHIPSEFVHAFDPGAGASLLGDKSWSVVFDNSKIKKLMPGFSARVTFAEGIRRSIAWFREDTGRQVVEETRNRMIDRILEAYLAAMPGKSRS
jgi:nucleoside-diphosphate-sugar epimerase